MKLPPDRRRSSFKGLQTKSNADSVSDGTPTDPRQCSGLYGADGEVSGDLWEDQNSFRPRAITQTETQTKPKPELKGNA